MLSTEKASISQTSGWVSAFERVGRILAETTEPMRRLSPGLGDVRH